MMVCSECDTETDLNDTEVRSSGLVEWTCPGCDRYQWAQLVPGEDY